MGFIKFVFILILIIGGINVFVRYVLPFLFKRFINKKMKDFGHKQDKQQTTQETQQEGKVTVQHKGSRRNPKYIRDDEGEYVDYKNVEED